VNEALARDLLVEGRAVTVRSGEFTGRVGFVQEYDSAFDLYMVSNGNFLSGHEWFELEPLFTMGQVVDVKLADQEPGSLLADRMRPFGMKSADLAEWVDVFTKHCAGRIKGVGDEQYSMEGDSFQKFEEMSLNQLFKEFQEEVEDVSNYAAMLWIRMERVRQALIELDVIDDDEEEIPSE
jgi:hypothetical protein